MENRSGLIFLLYRKKLRKKIEELQNIIYLEVLRNVEIFQIIYKRRFQLLNSVGEKKLQSTFFDIIMKLNNNEFTV